MTMPASTDLTGLMGLALALAAMPLAIPVVRRLPPSRRGVLVGVVAAVVLVPFGPLPWAAYVRGVTGDLSITTLVLCGGAILRSLIGRPMRDDRTRFAHVTLIAGAALALYPMALGVGLFDPYRLGYGSPWLVGALFAAALTAWIFRCQEIAAGLALATLAWTLRWYESTNVWDYLLDPFVAFYALGAVTRRGLRWLVQACRRPARTA